MPVEYTSLLVNEACLQNNEAAPARKSTINVIISAAAIATICLGAAFVVSGVSCAIGTICPLPQPSAVVQLYSLPAPVSSVYVNSKTGRTLVMQPRAAALQSAKSSDVQVPSKRERAAKLAVTGLLSIAAIAHPALADSGEDARLADLMKAWNEEYGTEFGQWDMSGYYKDIKPRAEAPKAVEKAPEVEIPRKKAAKELDPIDQVMAEWNKEYGSQYGTWDMSGYRPAKKVEAPAPVPVPAPVVKAPAPVAPAPVPEPPVVVKAAPAPAPVVPAPVAPKPAAPAAVAPAAPAAATTEAAGPSSGALIAGGLGLLVAGAAALSGNKGEETPETPAVPPTPTEGTAPPAPGPSADTPTDGPK